MFKKILKWVWDILQVLIIVYVIFITACILFRNKYGYTEFFEKYTFVTVTENSKKFVPSHDAGDLLIIKNQQFSIDEGDLIYYYATINEEYVVRSGVVESKTEDEVSALYVLNDSDKTSVASTRVLGKYVSVHPGKGTLLDVLESRVGFLFLVLLPILVVFIYQVYQLVVVTKYEVVEDDEEDEEDDEPKKKVKEVKEEKPLEKEEVVEKFFIEDKKSNEDEIEML